MGAGAGFEPNAQDRCIREQLALLCLLPGCVKVFRGPSFSGAVHFQGGVVGKYAGRIIHAARLILQGGGFGRKRVARGGLSSYGFSETWRTARVVHVKESPK